MIIISSIIIAIFFSGGIITYADIKKQEEDLVTNIETHARIASANSASALVSNDPYFAAEILHTLSMITEIDEARIYTSEGKEFANYQRLGLYSKTQKNFLTQDFKVVTPISNDGEEIGLLIITANKHELFPSVVEHLIVVILAFVFTGILVYFWSIRLQNYIYKPINHMLSVTQEVRKNDNYTVRVSKFYDDELGMLTDDFNLMLNKIEKRDQDLECQVKERTQQLEIRNKKLAKEMQDKIQAQEKLYESEKRFRNTFASAAIGMMLVSRDGAIIQCNHAICEMLGFEEEELQNKTFLDITYHEDREIGLYERERVVNGEVDHFRVEKRYCRKDGEMMWGLTTVSGVFDKDSKFLYFIAQMIDITEENRLSEELNYRASHDVLTGLLNRKEFETRIQKAWDRARDDEVTHILCYIDLDQFKVINDSCGHVAGDELLRQIASLLEESVRSQDSVARLGGDEFGVLMEYCSLSDGADIAEKIRKKIETLQFVWKDNRFKVASSIGVVEINSESSSVTELLQQADTACFGAKDAGRNMVSIYRATDTAIIYRRSEMQWVHRIQEAIEDDRFLLCAQPIVPTDGSDKGVHIEVLVRLISDKGEEIPPGAFLPAAERYGLITNIDRWVISHTLDWMQKNSVYVQEQMTLCTINLSGLTLSDDKFLSTLIDELYNRNISCEKVCFEITETAIIANLSKATNFIRSLRRLGCKFSLDDFGSGLSSFAYLKTLQVDFIKIDGMFVRDILKDPVDLALVRSINEMGKVMGKKTIAEFVETQEIFEKIIELGIDYAQGFGVGEVKPLSEYSNADDTIYRTNKGFKLQVVK